ncbi:hypothetical protein M8C21_023386, partial [Ambrosia artemisiifolia]
MRKESTVKLIAPSPYPVITFGPFASAINVLTSLSHAIGDILSIFVVGTVFMPPKWSLGYQQCPWSYDSMTLICVSVRLPRHLDIKETFPNPKSLADDLHDAGELKRMLSGPTRLHHEDQKIIYKDKEMASKTFLDIVGVKDGSKMVLLDDPVSREKRYVEARRNAKVAKAAKAISDIGLEVDRLGGQVLALESVISKGG